MDLVTPPGKFNMDEKKKMNKYEFNCWLTGLIEGDGTIFVPKTKRDSKNKLLYPYIKIAFHRKDIILAYKIQDILGYGNVDKLKTSKTILFIVRSKDNILDLIDRLNGNMRTPKILRLHLLIDWYTNDDDNLIISKLPIDNTSFGDNAWLSGISDADSNFNVILNKRKNNNVRVQTHWRLEFSQKTYHGKDQLYWAMLLSSYLNVNLYSRTRSKNNKIFSSFIIMTYNNESKDIIINYLNKYPLKSSKYLDYKDWLLCGEYAKKYKNDNKNLLNNIKFVKSNMNNNRTQFIWDHLD